MARPPRRVAALPGIRLSEQDLARHLRHLGDQISAVVPQRQSVRLCRHSLVSGSAAYSIERSHATREVASGRGVEHVVRLVETASRILHMGLTEVWSEMKGAALFREIRIRFYVSAPGEGTIGPPAVRLEWEDRDHLAPDSPFRGRGAGHPHWHVGAEELVGHARDDEAASRLADEYAAAVEAGPTEDDRLLLEAAKPHSNAHAAHEASGDAGGRAFTFKRFHFPARAGWADVEWRDVDDPQGAATHASSPSGPEDLARWAASAAKYMANEMRKYG